MFCGTCCAEPGGTLEVGGSAGSDAVAPMIGTHRFDEAPKATDAGADFMGTVQRSPQEDLEPSLEPVPSACLVGLAADRGGGPVESLAFTATLNMPKEEHPGFLVDISTGPFLRLSKIDATGPIPTYNRDVCEGERVRVGDFIVAVNDVKGEGRNMVLAFAQGAVVKLSVRRALEFTVRDLSKRNGSLGLDLSYQARSMSVMVREIYPGGVVARRNEATAGDQICEHDHIVLVDGKTGTSRQLVQAMTDAECPELVFARPAVE